MKRQNLVNLLNNYEPSSDYERDCKRRMLSFMEAHSNCFENNLSVGHVTGSAWLINETQDRVLLTHHKKLNKWLQLGGHANGDGDVLEVALREAREESGIDDIFPVSESIFDIDIHLIPKNIIEPQHYHYDVRFFLKAGNMNYSVSGESKELRWVPLDEVCELTSEESVMRLVRKTFQ